MEMQSVAGFLDYYESIRARTRRVARVIPDEHMEWRSGPGRMSFGDLLRHLAVFERYVFAENALGRPSRYMGHGREIAEGAAAVRAFFDATHDESMELFRSLTDADLQRRCLTPAGAPITVWKWLRAMIEHEVHHRGQMYLMLGMLGVQTPPMFGLTSEEVLARSVGHTGNGDTAAAGSDDTDTAAAGSDNTDGAAAGSDNASTAARDAGGAGAAGPS